MDALSCPAIYEDDFKMCFVKGMNESAQNNDSNTFVIVDSPLQYQHILFKVSERPSALFTY